MDFINGFLIILGIYVSIVCYKFFKEQLDDEKENLLNRIDKTLLFCLFFFLFYSFIFILNYLSFKICWNL